MKLYYRNTNQEWLFNLLKYGFITTFNKKYISISSKEDSGGMDHYGDIRITFNGDILNKQGLIDIEYNEDFFEEYPNICKHVTGYNSKDEYYKQHDYDNEEQYFKDTDNVDVISWSQNIDDYEAEAESVIEKITLVPNLIIQVEYFNNEKLSNELIDLLNKNNIKYSIGKIEESKSYLNIINTYMITSINEWNMLKNK